MRSDSSLRSPHNAHWLIDVVSISETAPMTSVRQIEANRRNACKSTGPITAEGKRRSRCNAVRHGLTAETVIGALEDAEDYKAFEATIIADYDAQSSVERELVLRLASLLWRLRRATTMETGLFEIQADYLREFRRGCQTQPNLQTIIHATFRQIDAVDAETDRASCDITNGTEPRPGSATRSLDAATDFARCFLRLANLPSYPLDRLSRYEAILWRQAGQILFALDALDRRKPQERGRRVRIGRRRELPADGRDDYWPAAKLPRRSKCLMLRDPAERGGSRLDAAAPSFLITYHPDRIGTRNG